MTIIVSNHFNFALLKYYRDKTRWLKALFFIQKIISCWCSFIKILSSTHVFLLESWKICIFIMLPWIISGQLVFTHTIKNYFLFDKISMFKLFLSTDHPNPMNSEAMNQWNLSRQQKHVWHVYTQSKV